MSGGYHHVSVLLTAATDALGVVPGGRYIDATFGGGGHSRRIAELGGKVLGLDADADAVARAAENPTSGITVVRANFRDIADVARANGFIDIDGVLFDLGVSSYELDTPERGFSYRFAEAPLDMRLAADSGWTAGEIIAYESEAVLAEYLAKYGEEERAGAIAHALVRARSVKPVATAGDLLAVIKTTVGEGQNLYPTASRVFQALRIAVNDELAALRNGLEGATEVLKSKGTIAVISFHSLEDRIVKRYLQTPGFVAVTKKPILPSPDEIHDNPRARSAKLRVAQKR